MIDADDLALLAQSFDAAATAAPGAGAADAAFFDLGWADLLDASLAQGARAAFEVLGRTGAAAALLDDVVAAALGLVPTPDTCVLLPAPHGAAAPGRWSDGSLLLDGVVSSRGRATGTVLVAVDAGDHVELVRIPADALSHRSGEALDPDRPFVRVAAVVAADQVQPETATVAWGTAVAAARAALAHQLIGASRTMLEMARSHAVDRVQFGRPVASFQAIRHKLADALVAIEGAASVAVCCDESDDPLLATCAKALAGKAALTTAKHAQQTLAGIGFTTDHPFHRFLKRVLVLDTLFGSARTLPVEVGAALIAEQAAPRLVEL